MASNPLKTVLVYLVTVALLFGVAAQLAGPIQWTREAEGTQQPDVLVEDVDFENAALLLLGPFRAVLVDWLWIRMMNAQQNGEWHEIEPLGKLITRLQPHFSEVYVFLSWNIAYNISHETEDIDEKWHWVMHGYNTAREGARRNPGIPGIKFWAGWVLYDKVGTNLDRAQREAFVTRYMKENNGRHPLRDAALWFERAHRTPGYQLMPHRTMMVHAYARLAEFYYVVEEPQRFQEVIKVLAQLVERLLEEYPDNEMVMEVYQRWGMNLARMRQANVGLSLLPVQARREEAVKSLTEVLNQWNEDLKGNPYGVISGYEKARICLALGQDAAEVLKDKDAACTYYQDARMVLETLSRLNREVGKVGEFLERVRRAAAQYECPEPSKEPPPDVSFPNSPGAPPSPEARPEGTGHEGTAVPPSPGTKTEDPAPQRPDSPQKPQPETQKEKP